MSVLTANDILYIPDNRGKRLGIATLEKLLSIWRHCRSHCPDLPLRPESMTQENLHTPLRPWKPTRTLPAIPEYVSLYPSPGNPEAESETPELRLSHYLWVSAPS